MGIAYRLAFYFRWQIGLNVEINREFIFLSIPFVTISICFVSSEGIRFFKD